MIAANVVDYRSTGQSHLLHANICALVYQPTKPPKHPQNLWAVLSFQKLLLRVVLNYVSDGKNRSYSYVSKMEN